jgi:uncharacterized protein (TIGR04562 family)
MSYPLLSENIINTVVGGFSAVDIPTLSCQTLDEAKQFLCTYGFDLTREEDEQRLTILHRRALIYIKDVVLNEGDVLPEEIESPGNTEELVSILLLASDRSPENHELQKWACALLRVAHAYVQLENDLFSMHTHEIQSQILKPIKTCIRKKSGSDQLTFVGPISGETLNIYKFEVKPYKSVQSSITKLLAKPSTLAINLLDRVGVRIVTKTRYDSFRVLEMLISENIISFPHVIPNQSKNSLFPISLVMDTIRQARRDEKSEDEVEEILNEALDSFEESGEWAEKSNDFSSETHRFLKFISRKLIHISHNAESGQRWLSFFYPYEVQILDQENYLKELSGPGSHEAYKERQRKAARRRVLGIRSH